jgi:riboflavin biosynthesis pyrimidine reductase
MSAMNEALPWARKRVTRVLGAEDGDRVIALMVASVDGRAASEGRSRGLSGPADRALMRAWRAVSDAIVVGTGTLEAERYGSILPEEDQEARVREGRPALPPILTISRSGDVDVAALVHGDADLDLVIYAPVPVEIPASARNTSCVVLKDPTVARVVAHARESGAGTILLEGGPKVLTAALDTGVVTDMSLTVAPVLVGPGPGLLDTDELHRERRLGPVDAEVRDGFVFLQYRVLGVED